MKKERRKAILIKFIKDFWKLIQIYNWPWFGFPNNKRKRKTIFDDYKPEKNTKFKIH